ncbi:MAG: hypothetical protein RLZZ184_4107 [Cyanobacteriota bacterium]|jgi:hypothetical protein
MNHDLRSLIITLIFLLHLYGRKPKIGITFQVFLVVLFVDFLSSQ